MRLKKDWKERTCMIVSLFTFFTLSKRTFNSLVFFLDLQALYSVLFVQVSSVRITAIYLYLAVRIVL